MVLLGGLSLVLEGAGPGVPVTQVGPDPAIAAVEDLPSGSIVLFPGPQAGGLPGTRTAEEVHYRLAEHDRSLAWTDQDLVLRGHLSHIAGTELPLERAAQLWAQRAEDPIALLRDAGVVALLVDLHALDFDTRERLDDWLVPRVGPALAESDSWSLYSLRALEQP